MDRKALVLYLENVRDLEVTKYKINQLWGYEKYKYNSSLKSTSVKKPEPKESDLSYILYGVLLVICIFVFIKAGKYLTSGSDEGFFDEIIGGIIGLGACALSFGLGIISFMVVITTLLDENKNKKKYKSALVQYEKDLKIANQNKVYNASKQKEWEEINRYYSNEYNKADTILKDFYAMNIIPKPYRDNGINKNRSLATACYLYDYMSSGRESFQMALLSNQIEDGIRRIEAKLDEIIKRLDMVIYQQRVIRDENRQSVQRQVNQNNRMLDSLQRMENNQQNIEEYSRLSANYNRAQAFISMAYYLKNS